MQDQGPSSCLLAVFSQRTTEGNGWSHPAPLKLTNLLYSCLSICFSKVILCQLFGKAWCGLNICFSLTALSYGVKSSGGWGGHGWEVAQPRCISEVWKCQQKNLQREGSFWDDSVWLVGMKAQEKLKQGCLWNAGSCRYSVMVLCGLWTSLIRHQIISLVLVIVPFAGMKH